VAETLVGVVVEAIAAGAAVEETAVESDLAYWGYRELLEAQEQMVPERSCKLVWSGRSKATTLSYPHPNTTHLWLQNIIMKKALVLKPGPSINPRELILWV